MVGKCQDLGRISSNRNNMTGVRRLYTLLARTIFVDGQPYGHLCILTVRADGTVVSIEPFIRETYSTPAVDSVSLISGQSGALRIRPDLLRIFTS